MLNCEKCGKEYSYGREIYHECAGNIITHGVMFEDSKKYHEWNCISMIDSNLYQIEEKIIESYAIRKLIHYMGMNNQFILLIKYIIYFFIFTLLYQMFQYLIYQGEFHSNINLDKH